MSMTPTLVTKTRVKFRPVLRKIVVRKCYTGEPEEFNGKTYWRVGNIVVTERRADYQHWCEIIDVSDDCELFTKQEIGKFVNLPEWKPNDIYRVEGTDDFVVREDLFIRGGAPAFVLG